MKTRAAIYVESGQPIVIDDVELPDPGPTQVLVKQFATGVCHSQLHQLHNPATRTPLLLGHESTGLVTARGSLVTHVKEGDHVMLTFMLRDPHAHVEVPKVKYRGQEILAPAGSSTWAEDVIFDQNFVVPLDPEVPTDVTSVIGCAVMTGCGAALNTAGVRAGDSVAVFGVGGVGLCIVQACANANCYPIIAVDLADDKLDYAEKFGATHGVNAARENAVARIRELAAGGADFAFDAIGVPSTMEQLLPAVRPGQRGLRPEGGTAVLVGVPRGEPKIPMREIFQAKVYKGSAGGGSRPDRDFPMYVRWYKAGKLPLDLLVTKRYKLEEVNEACAALAQGEILGRAILEL
ncbi:MAG: zinc-binding dehydrogenase [Chloroflexota bacterium]